MIGTPKEHWTAVIDHFRKRFFVATFDLACAHEAARIWMDATGGKKLSEVEWLAGIGKQKIKYDVQLLAIAIRNDADVIYSHDPDIRRLANGRIRVEPVPEFTEQPKLLDL